MSSRISRVNVGPWPAAPVNEREVKKNYIRYQNTDEKRWFNSLNNIN
jgi:hypothetical protein